MEQVLAVFSRNLLNFMKDKTRLIFSLVMPLFFFFIFSFVMKGAMGTITQPTNYLISGIIIMTVFQSSLNNSTDIIGDIASGFMKEIIVSPVARWQLSIGQIMSSTAISVIQGVIIVILGLFMGLNLDAVHMLLMLGIMVITGFAFSSLGLFLATVSKTSSTFQVMISVFVMPLTFLSGAYIPTTVMPAFLTPVILINPLTHVTSIFRYISMQMEGKPLTELLNMGVAFKLDGLTITPIFGLLIILLFSAVFFSLSVYKFNKADFSAVKVFRHEH